eukprot:10732074-Lingulodinium_polyedra.AAC.1
MHGLRGGEQQGGAKLRREGRGWRMSCRAGGAGQAPPLGGPEACWMDWPVRPRPPERQRVGNRRALQ